MIQAVLLTAALVSLGTLATIVLMLVAKRLSK